MTIDDDLRAAMTELSQAAAANDDTAVPRVEAACVSLTALIHRRKIEFEAAIGSSVLVAQAQGVLMARHRIGPTHSAEMLLTIAHESATRVRDAAAKVIDEIGRVQVSPAGW
jgi:hypothetical protein